MPLPPMTTTDASTIGASIITIAITSTTSTIIAIITATSAFVITTSIITITTSVIITTSTTSTTDLSVAFTTAFGFCKHYFVWPLEGGSSNSCSLVFTGCQGCTFLISSRTCKCVLSVPKKVLSFSVFQPNCIFTCFFGKILIYNRIVVELQAPFDSNISISGFYPQFFPEY